MLTRCQKTSVLNLKIASGCSEFASCAKAVTVRHSAPLQRQIARTRRSPATLRSVPPEADTMPLGHEPLPPGSEPTVALIANVCSNQHGPRRWNVGAELLVPQIVSDVLSPHESGHVLRQDLSDAHGKLRHCG